MKIFTSLCLCLLAVITVASCISDATVSQNIISITFDRNDEIQLTPGNSQYTGYVFVSVKDVSAFSENDVAFISDNTDIATVEFDRCVLGTYLYFKVTAVNLGKTYIYAIAKDGTVSEKVSVTVSDGNGEPEETLESKPDGTPENSDATDPETVFPELTDTKATESTSEESVPNSENITLVSLTSPIGRNQTAKISIKGVPNTEYSISVYYSTSESSAAGLEDKISDTNGNVSWEWKIGGKTSSGDYRIVISGDGESSTFYFTVE